MDDADLTADLLDFVAAAPSPFHAVSHIASRLDAAGFVRLDEAERWSLQARDTAYVVRDGGSIVAFRVGAEPVAETGFRLVGAHTDSPTLKVRPHHDVERAGYRMIGVETYGGVLHHTWLDRDLGVAGRLAVRDGHDGLRLVNVHLDTPVLRIPSLAIHLDREVNKGLELNPQQHLVPLLGPNDTEPLLELLASRAGVRAEAIVGHDLVLADTHAPTLGGGDACYLFAPRLDNLYSCHAGMHALIGAEPQAATQVLVANDHEEVGSSSAEGAAGGFLDDVLRRVSAATGHSDHGDRGNHADPQDHFRAIARSLLVSSDTAHAVHPNYADRHEPQHRPRLGHGPVLKINADQRYATDAGTGGWFAARCADAGVPLQTFVTRGDMPCGSTIGPLTATRTGIATVDVGNPILSMHSLREQACTDDIQPMIAALRTHLSSPHRVISR